LVEFIPLTIGGIDNQRAAFNMVNRDGGARERLGHGILRVSWRLEYDTLALLFVNILGGVKRCTRSRSDR
jgi:hypothetical protein